MDTERWQRLKEILDEARSLAGAARAAYLDQTCAGDAALRAEAESLLAFDDTESVLDRPIFDVNAEDPRIGQRIGPYRVLGLLGRGGMGAVYLASREDDFAKEVALKLIPRSRLRSELIRRFHEERQILAQLEHPAIARLLDGGTTDDGVPYLVMERVEGEPIDRYSDHHRLGLDARLELFRRVCAAVQLSHQHLVVHCDLKPANVLIAADGRPRLLDFGIAKLLDSERPPAEMGTDGEDGDGSRPLSLRYASPEQIAGRAITTATDVYALGVLLYELLAGHDPYGARGLTRNELIRAIRERQPEPPSRAVLRTETRHREDDETVERAPADVARARRTTPRRLARALSGDLDAIVLRCLAKEPAARYRTVARLVDDLDRHRDGHPVRARGGGVGYRVGKTLRRRWRPLAALALAVLLLIAAGVATFRQREAERERLGVEREAERDRVRAQILVDFVEDLIRTANPDRADGERDITGELLELARTGLAGDLGAPLQRSQLNAMAGRVYQNRGMWETAEALLRDALALQREHGPDDAHSVASRANELATVLHQKGKPEELEKAEALYRESLTLLGGCSAREPDSLRVARNLALLLSEQGAGDEAQALYDCVVAENRRTRAADDPEIAHDLVSTGVRHFYAGELAEAEKLLRQALAIDRANHGAEHTIVANDLNILGAVLHERGDLAAAAESLREALGIREKLLGPEHVHVANTRKSLAAVLLDRGDPAAAEPLVRLALEVLREPWRVADAESVLGGCLLALGHRVEAEPLLVGAEAELRALRGADDVYARAARRRLEGLGR